MKNYILSALFLISIFASRSAQAATLLPVGMDSSNGLYTIGSSADGYAISSILGLQTALDGKQANLTIGTTGQYIRGDLSTALFPQTDWNAVSGLALVLNKPTALSAFTNDTGYITSSALSSYVTSSALASGLATKQATITTGSTSQYFRGDLSLATFATDARSAISVTGDGSYNSSTGVITVNNPTSKTFSNPSRTLNSAFQVSTTQDSDVSYSIDISCTMSLTSGQSGTAYLEYADDSGFTTNVKTVARGTNSNSGTLTIGLALTQVGPANLSGLIPAGKYVRVRTANNTGTPTFTLQNAEEVLL